jgi:quercetin dioxygenase-like cupin family protein
VLESERLAAGKRDRRFYEEALQHAADFEKLRAELLQSVISADDQVWEDSTQGLLKHMVNAGMNAAEPVLDMYQQVLAPGGKSGRHRHFSEELLFVIEGCGYDLHWDPIFSPDVRYDWSWTDEPQRYDWQAGDYVWIPPYAIHQHFASGDGRARFISSTLRVVKEMGYDGLEQLEDAPGVPSWVVEGA